jgi:hypothetical protein
MVMDANGHPMVNPHRYQAMSVAFFTAVLTVVLALFGTGRQRWFLFAAGMALLAVWYSQSLLKF